jgi:PAS domain-containing protein
LFFSRKLSYIYDINIITPQPQPEDILTGTFKCLSLRTLFDVAADVMLLVADTGHIVLANPAAQLLFS